MNESLQALLDFIAENNGINDKGRLSKLVAAKFHLIKDRSVFYCADFAIRFSAAASSNFSNTVLSLSSLQKFDHLLFVVCIVTPNTNCLLLANSTFLKKISHSSQKLRENNIRGSFNGSDIQREFQGIDNAPENFIELFAIHNSIGFEENLPRLVEATNNISPSGTKFNVSNLARNAILNAPKRAQLFIHSQEAIRLKNELDAKVEKFKNYILFATLIDNVNIRGRVIEYLIAGEDEQILQEIIKSLETGNKGIPQFRTKNTLGDYRKIFDEYSTETDVKTKIMILNSNPKAYNLDKMLEFLSQDRSVFMFYFIGVDHTKIVNTVLVSMFQKSLLHSTILLRHWAGRNSRGVTQFNGKIINDLILRPDFTIDENASIEFLKHIINL